MKKLFALLTLVGSLLGGCGSDAQIITLAGSAASSSSASSSGNGGAGNGGAAEMGGSGGVGGQGGSAPTCDGDIALIPMQNEGNFGFYEDGAYACVRYTPTEVPVTVISFTIEYPYMNYPCTDKPGTTFAVGTLDQVSGLNWSLPPSPALGSGSYTRMVYVTLDSLKQNFIACAVLRVYKTSERSCISACKWSDVGLNGNAFWSDTGPDGHVLVPPLLEPLAQSPTVPLAEMWENTKMQPKITFSVVP